MSAAFLIMASVFVPLQSGADDGWRLSGERMSTDESRTPRHSTDPHEGLKSLGSFEHNKYHIRVFATDGGPRFSIYDAQSEAEIAALLSAKRVTELFPEIPLDGIDFSAPDSAPVQIMLAEPSRAWTPSGR